MTTVTRLKPRALRDAQAKLDAFIANARNELTAFGKDLEFDSDCWDVTEHYLAQGDRRAKQARVRDLTRKLAVKLGKENDAEEGR